MGEQKRYADSPDGGLCQKALVQHRPRSRGRDQEAKELVRMMDCDRMNIQLCKKTNDGGVRDRAESKKLGIV